MGSKAIILKSMLNPFSYHGIIEQVKNIISRYSNLCFQAWQYDINCCTTSVQVVKTLFVLAEAKLKKADTLHRLNFFFKLNFK